jgi:hypothetical protein
MNEVRRGPKPTKTITYNGETKFISEWAYQFGITSMQVNNRIRAGWSMERIASEPISEYKQRIGRKNMLPYTGHKRQVETLGIAKEMECVKNEKKIREDLEEKIRQIKEDALHKLAINKAIFKVLEIRGRRLKRIQDDYDHREEVNWAIAKVLEMRRSRATKMQIAA